VAPILQIFPGINKYASQFLVGPNALWPTQPNFWADPMQRRFERNAGISYELVWNG